MRTFKGFLVVLVALILAAFAVYAIWWIGSIAPYHHTTSKDGVFAIGLAWIAIPGIVIATIAYLSDKIGKWIFWCSQHDGFCRHSMMGSEFGCYNRPPTWFEDAYYIRQDIILRLLFWKPRG